MLRVLVTGANGMLGQDLCPILEDEGFEVIETDIDTLDITNPKMVADVLKTEKPDILVHCAAYTNVDKAEEEPQNARLINSIGTENISKACKENNIVLYYISTDYVFDGTSAAPYTPQDKPNPINVYGLTKFEGEESVKKNCDKYCIIRTSWLYGHHGKNFVETMISYMNKPELKVVDDQTGCPTWTVDLSNAIVKLIKNNSCGIYHVCGGGHTSWYGFACEIFKLISKKVNIIPCKTGDFPRPAKRPIYSVMDNNKLCRNWKLALKDYLVLRPEDIELEVIK